jgi:hypothetical protein
MPKHIRIGGSSQIVKLLFTRVGNVWTCVIGQNNPRLYLNLLGMEGLLDVIFILSQGLMNTVIQMDLNGVVGMLYLHTHKSFYETAADDFKFKSAMFISMNSVWSA